MANHQKIEKRETGSRTSCRCFWTIEIVSRRNIYVRVVFGQRWFFFSLASATNETVHAFIFFALVEIRRSNMIIVDHRSPISKSHTNTHTHTDAHKLRATERTRKKK